MSEGPVLAFGMMKKIINASGSLEDVLETERITQTHMIMTEDHQEGVNAFKEKRKPTFIGK
jgi:2-(1,2-epoxy-1,2-dihydrophenyl)acetyl-CoA isomerase